MAFDREEYVVRWASALWQSQIDAGLCSTPEPITLEMKAALRRAAEAAVDALENGDG
jgi:hypothetical protein